MMGKPLDRRPRDPNQLGKLMVDIMCGEVQDTISPTKKNPIKRRGSAGGTKGGVARAKKLSPADRSDIARLAAEARWKKS
jgi:hypothetical protein